MKFVQFLASGSRGLAVEAAAGAYRGLPETDARYPGDLDQLVQQGKGALDAAGAVLREAGTAIDIGAVELLPPLAGRGKIVCIGLNYRDHSAEAGIAQPSYPTVFARFASSLIGHGAPIVRPQQSFQLDYEGELVAVIGKRGRNISREAALDHVIGYSVFNDASIRDYQTRTPQWTVGKNFDGTGAFGPAFVTADELPPGAAGLRIETRLNGQAMQSASTADMVFPVADLIAILSEVFTLEPGDILITGTPSGVGLGRSPQVWMKPGDVVEVEIEGVGLLVNPIAQG